MLLVTIPRRCQGTAFCAASKYPIDDGPNPNPVIARTAARIAPLAPAMAQARRPLNPRMIRHDPSQLVRRNPHLTTSGAAKMPDIAQVSMTGDTTLAAAPTPPPRPPWT